MIRVLNQSCLDRKDAILLSDTLQHHLPYPFAPTLRKGNLIKGVNWKEIRLNTSSTFYPPSNFVVGFVPTHLSNVAKDSNISNQLLSKSFFYQKHKYRVESIHEKIKIISLIWSSFLIELQICGITKNND